MSEFIPRPESSDFKNFADNFFDETRDVRALKAAIMATVSDDIKKLIEGSYFAIAQLAVEVIGHGDPSTILEIYGAGGKIDDVIVGTLDTALQFARRRGTSAKDEFEKLAKIHDWIF